MDIPPYISVSILNNPSFNCTSSKEERQGVDQKPDITGIPKKRSFDVAFLISSDGDRSQKDASVTPEPQPSPNESIRSAFRKVGLGTPTFSDSRSPSPIDPIRTPSPPQRPSRKPCTLYRDTFFHPLQFAPRTGEPEKSIGLVGNGFLNPVRGSFLPTPIFGTPPMISPSFVTASLLPPSLAALTLPATNVCAKCNVSFRMTSDLVYHMRSHHKNDHISPDQQRRRRESDKLKCPVCNESFRERHHLTRHMTAHQDKDGDSLQVDRRTCRLQFCPGSPNYSE